MCRCVFILANLSPVVALVLVAETLSKKKSKKCPLSFPQTSSRTTDHTGVRPPSEVAFPRVCQSAPESITNTGVGHSYLRGLGIYLSKVEALTKAAARPVGHHHRPGGRRRRRARRRRRRGGRGPGARRGVAWRARCRGGCRGLLLCRDVASRRRPRRRSWPRCRGAPRARRRGRVRRRAGRATGRPSPVRRRGRGRPPCPAARSRSRGACARGARRRARPLGAAASTRASLSALGQ
mmetsp:Transcript_25543/g.101800  ORF Transcript_25543/g.101800 Transcript_25543/m.101800 type:complete len:237 (+) Transcript_25543:1485-2195(+)